MSEKQAGSRSVSRYAETEAKFCNYNFNVLADEYIGFQLSYVEILDSF